MLQCSCAQDAEKVAHNRKVDCQAWCTRVSRAADCIRHADNFVLHPGGQLGAETAVTSARNREVEGMMRKELQGCRLDSSC